MREKTKAEKKAAKDKLLSIKSKVWARARGEAKAAAARGETVDKDWFMSRVGDLQTMACPERVSASKYDRQKQFFAAVLRKYGLSQKAYIRLLHSQGNACAVCAGELVLFALESAKSPVVDHCHKTGKVRGILCHGCNVRVGRAEFEAEAALYDAAKRYLTSAK